MITLNHYTTPYKKADAFHVIEKLMENSIKTLTDEEAERLYKYFMPKTSSKKAKTAIEWCAKAAGKKDVRFYLNYLYSDGVRLIATDGHRLHVINTDLPVGYYCPNTLAKIDLDHTYPDIDRIIPDYKKLDSINLAQCKTEASKNYSRKTIKTLGFQEKILNDACNNADLINIAIDSDNKTTGYYGESEFGFFVIMPLRD